MCFSLSASLLAGGSLSALGVATLKKTKSPKEIPAAAIPFFFGIQQLSEGAVWYGLTYNNEFLVRGATALYTLFSHVFWPIAIPFALRKLEPVALRRKILTVFQLLGIGIGAYLFYSLTQSPFAAHIIGNHIVYTTEANLDTLTIKILYLGVVCLSCLASSHVLARIAGVLVFIAFGVSSYFYEQAQISVWCFFAALLSALIYFYFFNGFPRRLKGVRRA